MSYTSELTFLAQGKGLSVAYFNFWGFGKPCAQSETFRAGYGGKACNTDCYTLYQPSAAPVCRNKLHTEIGKAPAPCGGFSFLA